jgi:hypothetical protein
VIDEPGPRKQIRGLERWVHVKTTHAISNESAPVPAFDEFFNDWFPDLARADPSIAWNP